MKIDKCPACGYRFRGSNPSLGIIRLMKMRSRKCQDHLQYICNVIEAEIPSEDDKIKRFKFLQGISRANEDAIGIMIARYSLKRLYKEGYGYAYLRIMILKEDKDGPVKRANEKKRHGKPPKVRKDK